MGAADQDDAAVETQDDEGLAPGAVHAWVGVHAGGAEYCQIRPKAGAFLGRWTEQQALGELGMPGFFGEDANMDAVTRVGAGPAVKNKYLTILKVCADPVIKPIECRRLHRLVDVAPGDRILAGRLGDEKSVLRRTACALAGINDDGAGVRQYSFIASQHQFGEDGRGEVGMDTARVRNAVRA